MINRDNDSKWIYTEAPYFTRDEAYKFRNYYSESVYEPFEDYEFDPLSYHKDMSAIQIKLDLANDEDKDSIKQEMIDRYRWNPEVRYNPSNIVKAVDRMNHIIKESVKYDIIDMTSLVENVNYSIEESTSNRGIKPIHIITVKGKSPFSNIISAVTNSDFSHAAICIDNDFTKCYSFNLDNGINANGGFSIENIYNYPKEGRLAVFTFFIADKDHKSIKENIDKLITTIDDTTYSIANILALPFKNLNLNNSNSMICSQFVDSILKVANINITGKDSSHVIPGDLYRASANNGKKIYKTFDGIVKDFNHKKINRFINRISRKAKPFKEFTCGEDYLNYAIIFEAKVPIEVRKNGDTLLTNPFIDFDAEYSASHKLLLEYEKTNNINGMKYELARLYYMNYILEKSLYHNKYLHNKEKNIKTRARVLNDFKKYLKIVLNNEPDFNFGKYYEDSIFYPHTVEIKSSTMIAFKDIIRHIL